MHEEKKVVPEGTTEFREETSCKGEVPRRITGASSACNDLVRSRREFDETGPETTYYHYSSRKSSSLV